LSVTVACFSKRVDDNISLWGCCGFCCGGAAGDVVGVCLNWERKWGRRIFVLKNSFGFLPFLGLWGFVCLFFDY